MTLRGGSRPWVLSNIWIMPSLLITSICSHNQSRLLLFLNEIQWVCFYCYLLLFLPFLLLLPIVILWCYWRTLDPTPPLQSHWLHFTAQSWGSPSWSSLAICLAVCIRWTGVPCKLWGGQSCVEVCSLFAFTFHIQRVDVSITSFCLFVYNMVEPLSDIEYVTDVVLELSFGSLMPWMTWENHKCWQGLLFDDRCC